MAQKSQKKIKTYQSITSVPGAHTTGSADSSQNHGTSLIEDRAAAVFFSTALPNVVF